MPPSRTRSRRSTPSSRSGRPIRRGSARSAAGTGSRPPSSRSPPFKRHDQTELVLRETSARVVAGIPAVQLLGNSSKELVLNRTTARVVEPLLHIVSWLVREPYLVHAN